MSTLRRYWMFQLPGLFIIAGAGIAAIQWWALPTWTIGAALGVWLLKDLVVYPLVKEAYRVKLRVDPMIGRTGVVTRSLTPNGWVEIDGERWRARASVGALDIGRSVRVDAVEEMTLIVCSGDEETSADRSSTL